MCINITNLFIKCYFQYQNHQGWNENAFKFNWLDTSIFVLLSILHFFVKRNT